MESRALLSLLTELSEDISAQSMMCLAFASLSNQVLLHMIGMSVSPYARLEEFWLDARYVRSYRLHRKRAKVGKAMGPRLLQDTDFET